MGDFAALWPLDPAWVFLNHGSYGACPRAVLAAQAVLRERMESQPVRFMSRELEPLLDAARAALAAFVGAAADDLAFVPNATAGVNAVLRSLSWQPGDQLLVTDHEYPASRNALDFAAGAAEVVVAEVPFPLASSGAVLEAVLARVTPRTRLVLIDHVTSQTGLVFPVAELCAELGRRGIDVLVDGAHAPGMLALDVAALGATYYTGNCHKWLCAPKGAAFLWVRRDRQAAIRPLAISHGASAFRDDRSRFRLEFDWTGTADPTPWLCVPVALEYLGGLLPGGWPALRAANRAKVLAGRDVVAAALGVPAPCPDDMIGSLAALPLPDADGCASFFDPVQDALYAQGIEVPVMIWPRYPRRLIRISAQLYNQPEDYQRLADALRLLCRKP